MIDERLAAIRAMHVPFGIWDECGCSDEAKDGDDHTEIEEVGRTCEKMYDICTACCTENDYQREGCCDGHDHGPGKPICPTVAILDSPSTPTAEPDDALVEQVCEIMHNTYENAAAEAGWSTQEASRKPWSEVPEANKATMRVTARYVIGWLDKRRDSPSTPEEPETATRTLIPLCVCGHVKGERHAPGMDGRCWAATCGCMGWRDAPPSPVERIAQVVAPYIGRGESGAYDIDALDLALLVRTALSAAPSPVAADPLDTYERGARITVSIPDTANYEDYEALFDRIAKAVHEYDRKGWDAFVDGVALGPKFRHTVAAARSASLGENR